jgi:hypothetical protein
MTSKSLHPRAGVPRPAKWALLYLLVSGVALAAGCRAGPPPEARGRDIVRDRLGFAVDVPQGWTFRDLYGYVALEIYPQRPSAPAAPGSEATGAGRAPAAVHVVIIDREVLSLQDWADEAIQNSQELQPGLEVTSRTEGRMPDGREALDLALRNPRGVEPLIQRMRLTVTDRRAYALVETAPDAVSRTPAVSDAFKKCLDSFIVW